MKLAALLTRLDKRSVATPALPALPVADVIAAAFAATAAPPGKLKYILTLQEGNYKCNQSSSPPDWVHHLLPHPLCSTHTATLCPREPVGS